MNYSKLISAVGLAMLPGTSNCNESSCADHPELCPPAPYESYQAQVAATCQPAGFDTREGFVFSIKVNVTDGQSAGRPGPLGQLGMPSVYVQTSAAEQQIYSAQIQMASEPGVMTVAVNPNQLAPGPLKVRVVLPSAGTLQGQALATCVVTRSPILGDPRVVKLTDSPRGYPITGLVGVQIGTVVGADRQLLLVEQFKGREGANERWAELYKADSAGSAKRDDSVSAWSIVVQRQLQESSAAVFAAAQGVLMIYDDYLHQPTKQLSMFSLMPPNPTRETNRGSIDPNIGDDRTAVAAAADDQLMLLASEGNVSWFRVSAQPTLRYLFVGKTALITGEPILAARAERLKNPLLTPGPYFGAAWDKTSGNAILLSATASDAGKSSDLMAIDLKTRLPNGFQTALGSQQVVAAALGDLNGDGLEDLLIATSHNRLLWAAQRLDHSFAPVSELNATPPPGEITALAIGDVTKDGNADLAVIAGQKAYVYPGL